MESEYQMEASPVLCRMGCDFFGSQSTDGLCSKCYKDKVKKKHTPPTSVSSQSAAVSSVTSAARQMMLQTSVPISSVPTSTSALQTIPALSQISGTPSTPEKTGESGSAASARTGIMEVTPKMAACLAYNDCTEQVFNDLEKIRKAAIPISTSETMMKLLNSMKNITVQGVNSIQSTINPKQLPVFKEAVAEIDTLIYDAYGVLVNDYSNKDAGNDKLKMHCDELVELAMQKVEEYIPKDMKSISNALVKMVKDASVVIYNIAKDAAPGFFGKLKTWMNFEINLKNTRKDGLEKFNQIIKDNTQTATKETEDLKRSAEKRIDDMIEKYTKCLEKMKVHLFARCLLKVVLVAAAVEAIKAVAFVGGAIAQAHAATKVTAMCTKFCGGLGLGSVISIIVAVIAVVIIIYFIYQWLNSSSAPEEHVHEFHGLYKDGEDPTTCSMCKAGKKTE